MQSYLPCGAIVHACMINGYLGLTSLHPTASAWLSDGSAVLQQLRTDSSSGVLGGIRRIPTSGFFWQRILTSAVINKHGTFRPFATPVCVYPPPFLAIHHWIHPSYSPGGTTVHRHVTHFLAQACILAPPGEYDWMYWMYLQLNSCLQTEYSSNSTTLNANTSSMIKYYNGYLISRNITQVGDIKCYF